MWDGKKNNLKAIWNNWIGQFSTQQKWTHDFLQFGCQCLNTHLVAEIDKERDREREWMMKRNKKKHHSKIVPYTKFDPLNSTFFSSPSGLYSNSSIFIYTFFIFWCCMCVYFYENHIIYRKLGQEQLYVYINFYILCKSMMILVEENVFFCKTKWNASDVELCMSEFLSTCVSVYVFVCRLAGCAIQFTQPLDIINIFFFFWFFGETVI